MLLAPPLRYNRESTDRLLLRPFAPDDFPAILPLLLDREAAEMAEYPLFPSESEANEFFLGYLMGGDVWAIAEGESGQAIGYMDLHRSFLDDDRFSLPASAESSLLHRLRDLPLCEVGYAISAPHRGKGLMKEALGALLALCKKQGIYALTAYHHADNPASGRVLAACGFERLLEVGGNVLYLAVLGEKTAL